jgi:hypothetical protein
MKMRIGEGVGLDACTLPATNMAIAPISTTGARILFSLTALVPHYAITSYKSQLAEIVCDNFSQYVDIASIFRDMLGD